MQHFGRGAHGVSLWREGKTSNGFGPRWRGSVKQESPDVSCGEGQNLQPLWPSADRRRARITPRSVRVCLACFWQAKRRPDCRALETRLDSAEGAHFSCRRQRASARRRVRWRGLPVRIRLRLSVLSSVAHRLRSDGARSRADLRRFCGIIPGRARYLAPWWSWWPF